MNKEEIESLKILKGLEFYEYEWYVKTDEFEGHANEKVEKVEKAMKIIVTLINKQQKENEKLKNELKEIKNKIKDSEIVKREINIKWAEKIREKIEEITSYAYTSAAERDCQDYAIQVLKELLKEK